MSYYFDHLSSFIPNVSFTVTLSVQHATQISFDVGLVSASLCTTDVTVTVTALTALMNATAVSVD